MREMGEDGEPIEENLVHGNDDLTWPQVVDASVTNELLIYTRRSRKLEVANTSRTTTAQQVAVEDIEEDDEDGKLEEHEDLYDDDLSCLC